MERSFDFVILLDVYGELLSRTQRDVLDMRYNMDLSLSEIAQERGGVSRQSVMYSIKAGEKRLLELEECLGFVKRLRELSDRLEKSKVLLAEISADYDREGCDRRFARLEEMLRDIEREL